MSSLAPSWPDPVPLPRLKYEERLPRGCWGFHPSLAWLVLEPIRTREHDQWARRTRQTGGTIIDHRDGWVRVIIYHRSDPTGLIAEYDLDVRRRQRPRRRNRGGVLVAFARVADLCPIALDPRVGGVHPAYSSDRRRWRRLHSGLDILAWAKPRRWRALAEEFRMVLRGDSVRVTVTARPGEGPAAHEAVRALGGRISAGRWHYETDETIAAWLPIRSLRRAKQHRAIAGISTPGRSTSFE